MTPANVKLQVIAVTPARVRWLPGEVDTVPSVLPIGVLEPFSGD